MSRRNKIYIIIAPLLGLAFALFTVFLFGYYPVISVDKDFISAQKFNMNVRAFSIYYHNVVEKDPSLLDEYKKSGSGDFEERVADKLVEDSLVDLAVRREVVSGFQLELNNKLKPALGNPTLDKAANALFGLSGGAFREEILIPQAEKEILAERLLAKGKNLDDWLLNAKRNAKVIFFFKRFAWSDGKVVKK